MLIGPGCTGISGSSTAAFSGAGPSEKARRWIPPTAGRRCTWKTTRSTTPTSRAPFPAAVRRRHGGTLGSRGLDAARGSRGGHAEGPSPLRAVGATAAWPLHTRPAEAAGSEEAEGLVPDQGPRRGRARRRRRAQAGTGGAVPGDADSPCRPESPRQEGDEESRTTC